jgi:hypothetical protein
VPECHRYRLGQWKETIEPEGKAAKPADSDAVVGKGARIRGLEVRWSGPGLARRGREAGASIHANAIEGAKLRKINLSPYS